MAKNNGLVGAALLKTDPELYSAIDGNTWESDNVLQRGARVKKYRSYERGDHDANLKKEMRKMLGVSSDDANLSEFNLNYCKIIIDKFSGRLQVSEVTIDNESEEAESWLAELLERNGFDQLMSETFRGTIRDGDSFQMIDPTDLSWKSESAYDGHSGVVAIYEGGLPIWACKLWSEISNEEKDDETSANVTMKMIVYQPELISFWEGEENGNAISSVDAPDMDGLVANENEISWIIGEIPLVQYGNQRDNYTAYGESEIRVAIPAQNAINRTLHSMIMASELSAFKMIWAKGIEVDKEGITPGGVINLLLRDSHGKLLTKYSDSAVKFMNAVEVGEFNESDISNYTNQISTLVQQISQVTQTPIYGVTSQTALSGEALKQLEIGLLGKVRRFQRENTDAIKRLIMLTAEIQKTFNIPDLGKPPKFESVSVKWKSPEIVDVPLQLEAIGKLYQDFGNALFSKDWYRQQVGGYLDMNQKKIADEGEKADAEQSQSVDRLLGLNTEPTV